MINKTPTDKTIVVLICCTVMGASGWPTALATGWPTASTVGEWNEVPEANQLSTSTTRSAPERGQPRYLAVVVPSRTVELSAPREGTLDTVAVTLGDQVSAGAAIATLQTELLRYELAIARSALQAAERSLNKAHLSQAKAADDKEHVAQRREAFSDSEMRDAEYAVKLAAEEVAIAGTTIEQRRNEVRRLENLLERSVVTAPFAAHVAARYLDPGAVVGPHTPIVRLIASDAWQVRFALPAAAAARLSRGTVVSFTSRDTDAAVPCTVENIAPEIDQALQMIVVEAAIDVSAKSAISIKPGLEGFVHLSSEPLP